MVVVPRRSICQQFRLHFVSTQGPRPWLPSGKPIGVVQPQAAGYFYLISVENGRAFRQAGCINIQASGIDRWMGVRFRWRDGRAGGVGNVRLPVAPPLDISWHKGARHSQRRAKVVPHRFVCARARHGQKRGREAEGQGGGQATQGFEERGQAHPRLADQQVGAETDDLCCEFLWSEVVCGLRGEFEGSLSCWSGGWGGRSRCVGGPYIRLDVWGQGNGMPPSRLVGRECSPQVCTHQPPGGRFATLRP